MSCVKVMLNISCYPKLNDNSNLQYFNKVINNDKVTYSLKIIKICVTYSVFRMGKYKKICAVILSQC